MTQCTTPDGYPYTTSYPTCPQAITTAAPSRPAELPQTGVDTVTATLTGLVLIFSGLAMRLKNR